MYVRYQDSCTKLSLLSRFELFFQIQFKIILLVNIKKKKKLRKKCAIGNFISIPIMEDRNLIDSSIELTNSSNCVSVCHWGEDLIHGFIGSQ